MNKKEFYLFRKFIESERKKIDEDKYFQGILIKRDPGEVYIAEWIDKNAKKWREEWEKSKCQHCLHWKLCGYHIKTECNDFEFDIYETLDLSGTNVN